MRRTGNKENGFFVIMQLHLAGNVATIEVSIPPAIHCGVLRSMLIGWFRELDTEVALLHLHQLINHWLRCSRRLLFSCEM